MRARIFAILVALGLISGAHVAVALPTVVVGGYANPLAQGVGIGADLTNGALAGTFGVSSFALTGAALCLGALATLIWNISKAAGMSMNLIMVLLKRKPWL